MAVGWVINLFYLIFKPLIYIMKLSSSGLLWIFGQRPGAWRRKPLHDVGRGKSAWSLGQREGRRSLAPEETQMIRGVFNLDEHTVREAMVPRTETLALSKDASLANALRLFRDVPHARPGS